MIDTEIYFIRHAESQMNTQPHLICGRSNEALITSRGINEARQIGYYLLGNSIIPDQVYASPAVRATQTATNALKIMRSELVPIIDEDLQELDQGDWVGRNRDEVYTKELVREITAQGKDFAAPGGESMNEVGNRMFRFIDRARTSVLTTEPGDQPKRVFAFSHGLAIRCLASKLDDWPQDKTRNELTPNGSVSLFTSNNGAWKLRYLGRATEEL